MIGSVEKCFPQKSGLWTAQKKQKTNWLRNNSVCRNDHRQKPVNEQTARDDVRSERYMSTVHIASSTKRMCTPSTWCLSSLLPCCCPIELNLASKKQRVTHWTDE